MGEEVFKYQAAFRDVQSNKQDDLCGRHWNAATGPLLRYWREITACHQRKRKGQSPEGHSEVQDTRSSE